MSLSRTDDGTIAPGSQAPAGWGTGVAVTRRGWTLRFAFTLVVTAGLLWAISAVVSAQAPEELSEERVYVRAFETDLSQILSPDEIRAVTGRYEGKTVGITDLQALIEEINSLYRQKGHPLSQAVLPPQQLDDGVVRIRLVEVRVGEVLVEGNLTTRDEYFLDRMSLGPGDLFDFIQLDQDLTRFNTLHDVQLRIALRPGQEFGTTDLILTVLEPRVSEWRLIVDNHGRPDTGSVQTRFTYTHRSLRGLRDRFAITWLGAAGASSASVAYSVPIGRRGTRLEMNTGDSMTRVEYGPLKPYDISGIAADASLRLSTPLSVSPSRRVHVDAALQFKRSTSFFSGVKILSEAVDSLVLGLSTERNEVDMRLTSRHTFTMGQRVKVPPFYKYRGDLTLQRPLWGNVVARYNAALQLAGGSALPNNEKFSPGGGGGEEDEDSIDRSGGYSLGIELLWPLGERWTSRVFADIGGTFSGLVGSGPLIPSTQVTSVGYGIDAAFSEHVAAVLSARFPLEDGGGFPRFGAGHLSMQIEFVW